ncbi:O-succinylhomoserine sulfhydrylase [Sansalvadorimonas sp. 2012CJ34-2]|uniref:O-succinylhomoserine sulfhydrylase n=1 Tax=Parendozoicomonas callyspongiae TaxID=2942213 RepID=A0ABT0PBD8_9GAMM|nr:O-succinylhomoserine sulfhydrylase [Sansalvadorimonas sp. 2012CJ34-2]MCL6268697.1 O-succinylhomoserine sulfhydrylase [Sansalvadorimonas sp. 2012CJ34-2]
MKNQPELLDSQTIQNLAFETLAVRSGTWRSEQREHSEAMYLTSSFTYDSAAQAAAVFAGDEPGNVYTRYTNPGVRMFEERMMALEGAEEGCATASGMAAVLGVAMAHLKTGDHVVCSRSIFGTTVTLFTKTLAQFGVETSFVSLTDLDEWKAVIKPETKMLFLETPSNPLGEVADIEALAEIAHDSDALLVVDNCFLTPALQQPLAWGADIVIHSATKFLDGQGRCMGGVAVGSKELIEPVQLWLRAAGACLSPFNAWVLHKGLETLKLRMDMHCRNTQQLAWWLAEHPKVVDVHYSGLPHHPGADLARKQQQGYGGVLAFEVDGGREAAWKVIDSVQIISRTANLGDTRTTITHPATTTHCRLSDEDMQKSGLVEGLIRLAVGLESTEDLKVDLERGLSQL